MKRNPVFIGARRARDFECLDLRLFNLDNDIRKYIATNLVQNLNLSLTYAHKKLRTEEFYYSTNEKASLNVLIEMKSFFRIMVKTYQLKRALMMLMVKGTLPSDSNKLKVLYEEFSDTVGWKIILKIDELEESRRRADIAAEMNRLSADKNKQPDGLKNVKAIQKA